MSKLLLDRRALLVAGGSSVLLAACSNLIGPPAASPLYLLKPSAAPTSGPRVKWQLSVVLPEAAQSLDTDRIALIQPTGQMDYYANSAWQDRLPFIVQAALIEAFETSGRLPAIGRETDGLRSDYLLQTDIRDFQARYDVAEAPPTAVVRIAGKMIAARGRVITTSLSAHAEVTAGANTVPAVAAAFNQALSLTLGQIVEWGLSAPTPPPPPV